MGRYRSLSLARSRVTYERVKVSDGVGFVPASDIIDTKGLIKIIDALGTAKLEAIAKIVETEMHAGRFPCWSLRSCVSSQ